MKLNEHNVEHQLNPSDLTDEKIDRIAFAVMGRINSLMMVEKPLTKDEAAQFLKISYKTFERRLSSGHYPESIIHRDGGVMLFLPSELIQAIKKH